MYRFNNKELRAKAISAYMTRYGYTRAVCFSCGHASAELKFEGIDTLDISPTGDLLANKWFTIGDIHKAFPTYFDATSGHLPWDCMQYVADVFKIALKELPDEIYLPTGSGETLVCLKMAFPNTKITAVYNIDEGTEYSEFAPLNDMVKLLAERVIFNGTATD